MGNTVFYWSSGKKPKGVTLFFIGRHEKKHKGYHNRFFIGRHEKNIREIIEIHAYILMSCISSLLMIDYCVLSSPQWCSGVHSA